MLIINPSFDRIEIYDGSSPLVTISNKDISNITSIYNGIIALYGISKDKEVGIISTSADGKACSNYFKSKGYSVKGL